MHSRNLGVHFFYFMTAEDLIKYVENWAPPGAAWERDNVGLQVGDSKAKIKNILLALDLNKKVVDQAIKKNCNFIFTHHPFLFNPIKKIDFSNDPKAELIKIAAQKDITIFSAHTNLDFTKDGVSFELAKKLRLKNINFLHNQESNQLKLVVFVPVKDVEKVSTAIFNAGGGIIGEYSNCSYRLDGEGTFKGSDKSNPSIGEKGKYERVIETRLEVLVDKWKLEKVIREMIKAHPYEEVAYDVYPLANKNVNYGMGAMGELEKPMKPNDFLEFVRTQLGGQNLRYTEGKSGPVKKVAVCGGSGSDMLNKAIAVGADAFVTADVGYHTFQDAEGRIYLIDAGHYETEIHSLNFVRKKLDEFIKARKSSINVYEYTGTTNPVKFL